MITVRKSEERRQIANKDQTTWRTFDWENKADPLHKGFGALKIFNEEILPPGSGFILKTPQDMVVVTYVREGMVIYKGPLEKTDMVESDEFQQANTDSGTEQAAVNVSQLSAAHIFQSGFGPGFGPLKPTGGKKLFTLAERKGVLKLIASPDGKEASLKINQDVQMYSTLVHKGNHMIHELKPGRRAWLHVVKGRILANLMILQTGDGSGFFEEMSVSFTAQEPTEILLFDLA
jgi:quercetin 2,3-dioxygenase